MTAVIPCAAQGTGPTADSWRAVAETIARNTKAYWSGALARGATPLSIAADVLTWRAEVARREVPQWATPHVIAREWPLARLRDFTPAGRAGDAEVPTIFFPPQAGHSSCIVDYAPNQSQVRTALAAGLSRVYSMDWTGATTVTKDAGIEAYLDVISAAVDHVGGRANLVGDCQGGWLAVIYAALHPDAVHLLTIAGAPIDFHAGEPVLHDWVRKLSPSGDMNFYRRVVAANGGVLPGEFLLAGFKTLQPEAELDRQLELLVRMNEPEHVARYHTFETWFQYTQPLPGAFYLWIVEHLFQRNELIAGTLEVRGQRVDLADITCPLNLLAGATDHITPPLQVFALADYAGTPAAQVTRRMTTGGHLGLFMGRDALRDQWLPLFTALADQSRVRRTALASRNAR